nr:capsular polysaccharide biosynthesis protein Cps4bC [Actinobacillus pleuropneumoniae]
MKSVILDVLKNTYSQNYYCKKIDVYKNVVFIDIKTQYFYFALEMANEKDIELIFRDDDSLQKANHYFNYPFQKGNKIYVGNFCTNNLFYMNEELSLNNMQTLINRISHIISVFINIENTSLVRLSESNILLKNIKENSDLYLSNQVYLDMSNFMEDKLLSIKDTIQYIIDNELSIARFGDGEIRCMVTRNGCSFQNHNWKLMNELREMCLEKNDKLLICYPSLMVDNAFWSPFWNKFWSKCKFYLRQNIIGDSFITRPEAFYFHSSLIVEKWKEVWNNKNVCFITGENSRFNTKHYIFNNIKTENYIYSKPKNAYDDIDNIISKCTQLKDIDIFLIALGPTGTALAYRLSKLGYRALDIGHLNNSYDTVFNKAPRPELISAK